MSSPLLSILVELGVDQELAQKALQATGSRSVDGALEWIATASESEKNTPASTQLSSVSGSLDEAALMMLNELDPLKMILAVRQDLGMSPGKVAAQCSHAALGLYLEITSQESAQECNSRMTAAASAPVSETTVQVKSVEELSREHKSNVQTWLLVGQRKIVVKLDDEAQMKKLHEQALLLGVPAIVIHDAGHTEVEAGTATVLGLGPGRFNQRGSLLTVVLQRKLQLLIKSPENCDCCGEWFEHFLLIRRSSMMTMIVSTGE